MLDGSFLPAVSKDCQHEAAGGDQGDGQRVDGAYMFAEKGDGLSDAPIAVETESHEPAEIVAAKIQPIASMPAMYAKRIA